MARARFIRRSIELLLLLICMHTFIFHTPVGELLRYGAHKLWGSKVKRRALVSYFQTSGEESRHSVIARQLALPFQAGDPLYQQAKALSLSPKMIQALLVILSDGKLAKDGRAQIKLSKTAAKSLSKTGVLGINKIAKPELRRSELIKGISALKKELQSEHGAIAALRIDFDLVKYALGRARASGRRKPESFTGFLPYLPSTQRARAKSFVSSVYALETAFGFQNPIHAAHRVTSKFGYRVHPVLKTRKKHTGIDLAIPTGTALHAAAAGRVVYATRDGINGNFIKLDHGNGLTSAYCHASKLLVKRNGRVKRGQTIAKSGMSGRATGPHLHFQIEIDDVPIDPALFIRDFGKGRRLSLEPKIIGDGRGFAELNLHIANRSRTQGQSEFIEQLKLH